MSEIQLNQLGVHLKVRDFDASRRFYDALGFQVLREFGPGYEMEERYRGVVYAVGDAFVELAEGHKPIKPYVFEEPITSSKISLMVNVGSLLPVVAACEEHGIPIRVPPRRYPWGATELVVQDPDGLIIAFVATLGEEERQQLQAKFAADLNRTKPDYTEAHVAAIEKRLAKET